jgi:hypothetical protein
MTFSTLIALAAALWILSCTASSLALYFNFRAGPGKWRAASILSGVALLISYYGLSHVHIGASKTVNNHVVWSVNSQWFFVGALVLGAASLAFSLWNWRKAHSLRAPAAPASGAYG